MFLFNFRTPTFPTIVPSCSPIDNDVDLPMSYKGRPPSINHPLQKFFYYHAIHPHTSLSNTLIVGISTHTKKTQYIPHWNKALCE